ncbi:MAG: hypothetical protein PVJ73_20485 [Acidobacteriota bacterium]
MVTFALTVALSWALGVLMHWWPRLPARWRRVASIATSAAGLAFLIAGTAAEGLREIETTSLVVVGPAYLTGTASASASLHYYVLTAVCLLLGFAGLALGGALARWLRRHWLISAVAVAWLVTVIRFLLEKSAAPHVLTQAVGITWMAPVAGAFYAVCLREEDGRYRDLVRPLVSYAFLVRGFVALVAVLATRLGLGTHYDLSPIVRVTLRLTGTEHIFAAGSWWQIFWLSLVPQLLVWTVYTVAVGLVGGALAWRWSARKSLRRGAAPSPETLAESGGND